MTKKVLCIGINNYPGTNMDLHGCADDAQDWTNVLQYRGFILHFIGLASIDGSARCAANGNFCLVVQ